jgi:hypothetical protein
MRQVPDSGAAGGTDEVSSADPLVLSEIGLGFLYQPLPFTIK